MPLDRPIRSELSVDSKYTKLQKKVMITAAVLGLLISIIIAWIYTTQGTKGDNFNKNIIDISGGAEDFFKNFFLMLINFLTALPINFVLISKISLHIYSKFIEWDVHAYTLKDIPTYVNDPKKLEALGYTEHLFASKNGILTENNLVFKMCSIGDIIYGTEDSGDRKCTVERVDGFNFKDQRLHDDIIESNINGIK